MEVNKRNFPENLFYDTHYQWVKKDENKVYFGLTPYGLEITGDILYLALPAAGTQVEGGNACGSLEAGKWVGRVYSPVSGRVTKVNENVVATPALINQFPYNSWFAEIEITNPGEFAGLMTVAELCAWLTEDEKADA
ncbi:glycine cleavage system protein H [Sporomusa acidovorans]|uniref:Glycine cleavage system H protein n=1 Tax=Sporomusa acidovorans (strain ATCC 49682 / DSM 3132 / Mol) TaxID=1123286 RepID=A0ABZ3J533_SPOA4|nr:glycine cleavage system protein H [Sporomusa acidovorans]OZC15642.1 glycine cleavage system H protein [Sporomusa acidovorans DSM 3132]SDE88048.1 glycine cleavage system H protein [Sporomusa acidovorans]